MSGGARDEGLLRLLSVRQGGTRPEYALYRECMEFVNNVSDTILKIAV